MNSFEEIIELAQKKGPKKMCVAVAQDKDVLSAIKVAVEENLVKPILFGDENKIREISKEIGLNLDKIELVNVLDITEASKMAVERVSSKKADIVMKGLVDTSIVLKAALDKEKGLRTNKILSHVGVFKVKNYHKIFFVTDAAMNIAPGFEEKIKIIENAVELAHSLGIETPNVAVICAKEKVTTKMQATLDAEKLVNLNHEGKITGCKIGGPFAFDNAISKEAAELKGMKDEIAGEADILLMPNIESGNVLYKALTYFSDAENAGLLLGSAAPIVLTSRSDSDKSKLNSIALGVLHASNK